MKTKISFYLNDINSTEICRINDAPFIPFKKGDKCYFSVAEIYPSTVEKLKAQWRNDKLVDDYVNSMEEKRKKFWTFRFKIISVYQAIEENENNDDDITLTIEYTCKKCQKFYWKWWFIKRIIVEFFKIKKDE